VKRASLSCVYHCLLLHSRAVSWLETVCVVIVYLSLALGNVAAIAGLIRVALEVIKKYKVLRKAKPKSILGATRRYN
jgi:hypothetical protein